MNRNNPLKSIRKPNRLSSIKLWGKKKILIRKIKKLVNSKIVSE